MKKFFRELVAWSCLALVVTAALFSSSALQPAPKPLTISNGLDLAEIIRLGLDKAIVQEYLKCKPTLFEQDFRGGAEIARLLEDSTWMKIGLALLALKNLPARNTSANQCSKP